MLIDKFVEERISIVNRMKKHYRNVQENFKIFNRDWEKEIMLLMSYEENMRFNQGDCAIELADHMAHFTKDFQKSIFKIIYNYRLISHLKICNEDT